MSSTSQPTTFVDLYTDLQNRVRASTGVTATETIAKRYINIGLIDMHVGFAEKFLWAERRAILVTHPGYSEGTVSINQGSTALTGSGTLWNSNNINGTANCRAGGKLTIASGSNVYEVSSVASDTSTTLTSSFIGTQSTGSITAFADAGGGQVTVTSASHGRANSTNIEISETTSYNGVFTISNVTTDTFEITDTFVANDATGTWKTGAVSGATYRYFEDELVLASDFLRPVDQRQFADDLPIELIGRNEFRRRFVKNSVPGRPLIGTIVERSFSGNTTPVRRLRVHPPPDQTMAVPYSYITSNLAVTASGTEQTSLINDTDEPIVPLRYRHSIVFHALYHWYRDKKDDVRSAEAKGEYTDLILRTVGDTEIGQSHPRIRASSRRYRRRSARPWSGVSGRYDINGRFDRLEDL